MPRTRNHAAIVLSMIFVVLLCAVPGLAADKGPIKLGYFVPQVGPFAWGGLEAMKGFKLALEEAGYKAGGRQVLLIPEDTEGKPELGPTKARKLIENEKVHLLAGINNSGVALSMRDIVHNSQIPLIITTSCGAEAMTHRLKSPYIFRTTWSNGQHEAVAGWYAAKKLGWKRVIVFAADFAGGHERADGFIKSFKAEGGQIVEEIYTPLATTDFAPYLSRVLAKSKEIDGVWGFVIDTGAIRFINQYAEYGLKGKVPLFTEGATVDDSTLNSMKDNAVGIRNYLHWSEMLNTPENQRFLKVYRDKYKETASLYAEQGYFGAKVILKALEAVKGDVEDKQAFMAALRKTEYLAPQGKFRFDANQNAVWSLHIREVRKIDNKYINVVLETIPDVDQDWTPAKLAKASLK
jgi:branched-chain amino acid transport system substrate-binding protein